MGETLRDERCLWKVIHHFKRKCEPACLFYVKMGETFTLNQLSNLWFFSVDRCPFIKFFKVGMWENFQNKFFFIYLLWEIRVVKKCSITLEINKNFLCEERQTTAVNETPNEESRDATGVTLQVDFNWIPLDTGEWEKVNKLNYSLSFSIWIKTKTKWLFISGSSDSGNIFSKK